MIRISLALTLLALSGASVLAQEATPATPPAGADIEINPAAPIDATPKQANLLTGLYATKAVIEICAVQLDTGVQAAIDADAKRIATGLGMDDPTAEKAYTTVKADVEKTMPDCAEGSDDRQAVTAVTSIYAAQISGTPTPAPAAATAPAN